MVVLVYLSLWVLQTDRGGQILHFETMRHVFCGKFVHRPPMHLKQILKTHHIKVCLLLICCNAMPELDTWHVIQGGVFIILETRRLGHIQRPDITMVFTNWAEHCIMFPSCCHLLIPNPLETMSLTLIKSLIESSRSRRSVTECHACVTRRCH